MPDKEKYEHLIAEARQWTNKLELLKEDIITLKNRLSIRISASDDAEIRDKADAILLRLINKDVLVSFLAHELADVTNRPAPLRDLTLRLAGIGEDIRRLAASIGRLRFAVDNL